MATQRFRCATAIRFRPSSLIPLFLIAFAGAALAGGDDALADPGGLPLRLPVTEPVAESSRMTPSIRSRSAVSCAMTDCMSMREV